MAAKDQVWLTGGDDFANNALVAILASGGIEAVRVPANEVTERLKDAGEHPDHAPGLVLAGWMGGASIPEKSDKAPGQAVLETMEEAHVRSPLLIFSSETAAKMAVASVQSVTAAFLPKPSHVNEIIGKVSAMLAEGTARG